MIIPLTFDVLVSVDTYSGDNLTLLKLDRKQMGAYLCIASNDVPPAVSKRITLNVNCEFKCLYLDPLVLIAIALHFSFPSGKRDIITFFSR